MSKVTFWKFVSQPISTTQEQAKIFAEKIESGEVIPMNNHGERFYKLMGWSFDIGRKPYLVQYAHGSIERHWALSVTELRRACYLSRNDKVVADPFFERESMLKKAA